VTRWLIGSIVLFTLVGSGLIAGAVALRRGAPATDLMAYSTYLQDQYRLRVMDGARRLTASLGPPDPRRELRFNWNWTGLLVYSSEQDGNQEIYLTDLLSVTNISNHPAADSLPVISADGRIAFTSERDGNTEIYLWEAGTLTNLSQYPGSDNMAAWSVDGRLAWVRNDNLVVIYDAGELRSIPVEPTWLAAELSWSRDGRLAWCALSGTDCTLMIWDGRRASSISVSRIIARPVWNTAGLLAFQNEVGIQRWNGDWAETIIRLRDPASRPTWRDDQRLTFVIPQVNFGTLPTGLYEWNGKHTTRILTDPNAEYAVWIPARP
jgi:WD40 repeat protein